MESSAFLAAEPEMNDVAESGSFEGFHGRGADFEKKEASRLGQAFIDAFLKIRRLVQAAPTYQAQMEIWSGFTRQLLFPDSLLLGLEELIEWKKEE